MKVACSQTRGDRRASLRRLGLASLGGEGIRPGGGEGCSGWREQYVRRLGGERVLDLSGKLKDPCGWGEAPSLGEGAQEGQGEVREKMKGWGSGPPGPLD